MSDDIQIIPTSFNGSGQVFRNLESYPGQVWTTPPAMSAQVEGQRTRRDIVRAARHVERYSEHIRGGIDRKADMVVGPRLMARATPDFDTLGITDKETQKKIRKSFEREFNNWAYDRRLLQDGEGHYDFGGMMWLALRNITGPDGECMGVIQYDEERAKLFNHRWATFVTLLDPDRLETPPEQAANPNVHEGKVVDDHGRMIGFYVRKKHPSDPTMTMGDMSYTLVPRETREGRPVGFHWFVKSRASQLRGVSTLVTILKQTNMLDKFDDALLAAATINQVLATYIESPASTDVVSGMLAPAGGAANEWGLFENKLNYYDKVKMRVGGARIPILPPGDKITMSAVDRGTADPTMFRNGFLRQFASSLGLSYEQTAKNFSDANYSAARAALLDIWQGIMRLRFWFGQHVAGLVYEAVIEEAIKKLRTELPAGTLASRPFDEYRTAYCACLWTGPGFPQIDPEKEAKAAKALIELKIESREEIIAQRGRDIEDVFDEIESERDDAESRGFMLDPLAPGTPGGEDATINPDEGGKPAKPKPGKPTQQRDGDGDGQLDEDNQ